MNNNPFNNGFLPPAVPGAPAPQPQQYGAPAAPAAPRAAYVPQPQPQAPAPGAYGVPAGPGQARPAFGAPANPFGGQPAFARRFNGQMLAGVKMAGARNPYLLDGQYLLEIEQTMISDRKGSLVVEFKILASTNPDRTPGMKASWVQTMKDADIALPSMVRFIVCACGYHDEISLAQAGIDIGEIANAVSDPKNQQSQMYAPNPLKGRQIIANVNQVLTKDNKPFTRHDFFPAVAVPQ